MRNLTREIGWLEAIALILVGIVVALVVVGQFDGVALIILLIIGYFGYMAQGVIAQAQRFRPVEPHATWLITMLANLALMALGIGAFGWYLAGGGATTWIPFLIFIAGFIALRQWRNGVVVRLYAWRTPALTLLQKGDYRRLIRELEDDATAGAGHPDKLAMVALAYIELNKLDRAEQLLQRALSLAPDFASVNGALGSLRRHQARYADAVEVIQRALVFEDNVNSTYYLGLCQFLAGDYDGALGTLTGIIDNPELIRQGQVYGAYILGQIAEQQGDPTTAKAWYDKMQEGADRVIPALDEEARRHKQSPYGETLKEHVRAMRQIIKTRDGVE